jgi:glycosyltransferase involved in cell wall biosynthesis
VGLNEGGVLVGHIGRFREEKGQVFLLQALRSVAERSPNARFLVVGGGTDLERIEKAAAAPPLAGRVAILGYQEDVRPYLAAMDIFVLPSQSEGMPNALMEAMSMRRACVATRVGGTRELLDDGHAGPLVDYGDREALADRITELVEDAEKRRRFAFAARRRMEEVFSMERMMENYQSLYDEALASAAGARRKM